MIGLPEPVKSVTGKFGPSTVTIIPDCTYFTEKAMLELNEVCYATYKQIADRIIYSMQEKVNNLNAEIESLKAWTEAKDVEAFNRGYKQAEFELGIVKE